jgi:hypothetical protein
MTNSSGSDREVAATWNLRLDQESYVAGDTLCGAVVLTVHEPIAFEGAWNWIPASGRDKD